MEPNTQADQAWYAASARLQRIAAKAAQRSDLIVRLSASPDGDSLGKPPGQGWSEIYFHDLAEIRLTPETFGASLIHWPPSLIDLSTRSGRQRFPALAGALSLGVAHARHTAWTLAAEEDEVLRWCARLLERARVTHRHLASVPAEREWLRQIAPSRDQAESLRRALAAYAQSACGVLTPAEVIAARNTLGASVGAVGMCAVEQCVNRALLLADGDQRELMMLARDLAGLLPAQVEAVADLETGSSDRPLGVEQVTATPPPSRHVIREEEVLCDERALARASADRVFGRDAIDATAHDPDASAWRSARVLAGRLRKARFRAAIMTDRPSQTPPGRLILGEAMRYAAQRANHAELTARPWRQRRRHAVDQPPIKVGLSWDISRSQTAMHAQIAEVAWVLAWAIGQVGGQVAATAWNQRAQPVVWPGRRPQQVLEPACHGSSGGCPESLRALAAALELDQPSGPRLVVVASDGRLPNWRSVHSELTRLAHYGVQLIWLGQELGQRLPPGVAVVEMTTSDTLVTALSEAVVEALAGAVG